MALDRFATSKRSLFFQLEEHMKFISNIIQLVCLMILGIAVSAVAWVNAEVAMVIILIGCYVIGRKGIRQ